jgi:hypothetical protein
MIELVNTRAERAGQNAHRCCLSATERGDVGLRHIVMKNRIIAYSLDPQTTAHRGTHQAGDPQLKRFNSWDAPVNRGTLLIAG